MKRLLYVWLVLVGAGLMTGCATKGKPFQAVQPIPSGKGLLYVYNDPSHRGRCEVMINDSGVGCLRGADYLAFQCPPGPLTVGTGWETEITNLTVLVETNAQTFVRVECRALIGRAILSLGLAPDKFNITPRLMPEPEALAQIQKMGLGESCHGLASDFVGTVTPGTDLAVLKTFYVALGEKESKTAPFIVSGLSARGREVKTGPARDVPPDTQCLVQVREDWFWDLGTYLLTVHVEFLDPKTKAVYASAKIRRAEPQGRRGPKVMAAEALNAIFNHGLPEGVEEVR